MNEREPSDLPQWKLERFLLRELPKNEMEQIRRALEDDVELRTRFESLQQSDEEVLATYPSAWMGRRIRNRAGGRTPVAGVGERRWLPRLWPVPVASLAVAFVTYVVVLPTFDTRETQPQLSSDDGIRLKGLEPHLILHRKRADGTEPLQDGALASAGDLIQIQYNGVSSAYGVILSMDGRGNLSCHLPEDCGDAARLDPAGGAVSLPFSIELDDAPSWERFHFITSAEPFSANQVMMAVRTAADDGEDLDLPAALDQFSIRLNKREQQIASER